MILNFLFFHPIDKFSSKGLAIDSAQFPRIQIVSGSELNGESILFSFQDYTRERELFHRTKIPPEAPIEGMKSKLSNLRGANFLMKGVSKESLFASWMQIIQQEFSSILFLMASHLSKYMNTQNKQLYTLNKLYKTYRTKQLLISNKVHELTEQNIYTWKQTIQT